MQKIPQVDLNDFLSEDSEKKEKFVKKIGQGFSEIGFIAVKNHLLIDDIKDELYAQIKMFFNLSEKEKSAYIIKGLSSQRGFTPVGKEHAKGRSTGDLKEFWHWGQFVENEEELLKTYPDNVIV